MKISPNINKVAVFTGLLLGAFAISALADWSAPLSAPPTCTSGQPGCDAPLNVGGSAQAKSGALGLNETVSQILTGSTLDVNGTASANKLLAKYLQITGGTLAAGNVLTSDANGNATWQTPTGGGSSSGVSQITAGTNITISPTTGTGNVTINANASAPSGLVLGGAQQASGSSVDCHSISSYWGSASAGPMGPTCSAGKLTEIYEANGFSNCGYTSYLCIK